MEKILTKESLGEVIHSEAQEIAPAIVIDRRIIHQYAEIGFDLPKTTAYVMEQLRSYGYEPEICGKAGIVATVGETGKTLLLRADMDALPIPEQTGLPFAASNGNSHSCGHDFHTSMLLGAARLLKEHENELQGRVKLMFEPAEERLQGAKAMVEDGLLDNPKVDAAFGMHMIPGQTFSTSGTLICRRGILTKSGDVVKVIIHGKDTHGGRVYEGVDALSIASFLNLALQTIITKEIPSDANCVVLVGTTKGGTSSNTVPGTAEMEISIRTEDNERREFIINRIKEISEGICKTFKATTSVEHSFGTPVMVNEDNMTEQMIGYAHDLLGEDNVNTKLLKGGGGSEDFAHVTQKVPSTYFYLGGGSIEEGYSHSNHTPFVIFNEKSLPVGTAVYTYLAMKWLEDNA